MEWVETTGKSVEEARNLALDRLGVAEDEAEFEVLDEPRQGLFGRVRGEARVRARVRPTAVRPKQDRRTRGRKPRSGEGDQPERSPADDLADTAQVGSGVDHQQSSRGERRPRQGGSRHTQGDRSQRKERTDMGADDNRGDTDEGERVEPAVVGQAAVEFMTGLAAAFGASATASLAVDGNELDVQVEGAELGLLIGPGGRTLMAVQDLARVAAQRRLGDHETRLRIDVAGYREKRRAALEKFTSAVANEVLASGASKALEPMVSADRKVVHDAIQAIEGVTSHSDGEEPRRRVVITPG
jgi:spoIIIJ-associated protein